MFINLSDVLSEHHKPIDEVVSVEMTEFQSSLGSMPIIEKGPAHIVVKHVKLRELTITGEAKVSFELPCDRCLETVRVDMDLEFTKNVDLRSFPILN